MWYGLPSKGKRSMPAPEKGLFEHLFASQSRSCMPSLFFTAEDNFSRLDTSEFVTGQDLESFKLAHIRVLQKDGRMLRDVPEALLADREVVLTAVRQNGSALRYADPSFFADREIVLAAVTTSGAALRYADVSLIGDREIVMRAARGSRYALAYSAPVMRSDHLVVMEAVKNFGMALEYASEGPRASASIVYAAVQSEPHSLEFAAEHLRDDYAIVETAVEQDGLLLRFASPRLQGDHSIVLAAVTQNGAALRYAREELTEDRDIVLRAVFQNSEALEYAGKELRFDREVVRIALSSGVEGLSWAGDGLLSEEDLEYIAAHRTDDYVCRVSMALTGRSCVLHCAHTEMAREVYDKSCRQLRPNKVNNDHIELWLATRKELLEEQAQVEDVIDYWQSGLQNKKYVLEATDPAPQDVPLGKWPGVRSGQVNYLILKFKMGESLTAAMDSARSAYSGTWTPLA
mmetsp:Transcript_51641/g.122910  ORF Transcript_51641/g.122910 Transcript_51641/m.122910 type:complete len:460 (-) Transcript_51641:7-1386(-)